MANFHQLGGRTTPPPPTLPLLDVNAEPINRDNGLLDINALRHNVNANPFAGQVQNAPHVRANRTVTQLDPKQLNAMSDWELANLEDDQINALSDDTLSKLDARVIEKIMSPGSVWQIPTDTNGAQFEPVYIGENQHIMDDPAAISLIQARVFNKLSDNEIGQISAKSLENLSKGELENIEPKVLEKISDNTLEEIHPALTIYLNADTVEATIARVANSSASLGFSDKTKP